jgi:hypothetical protein
VIRIWKVVGFLMLASCAFARLGEDRDQLVVRLGPVKQESKHFVVTQGRIEPLGPALFFQKDDWFIQCDLVGSNCARITYSRKGEWTAEQIATLLADNSQGQSWVETKDSNKMIRKWSRQDGGSAVWNFAGSLQLVSGSYLRAEAALIAKVKAEGDKKPDL